MARRPLWIIEQGHCFIVKGNARQFLADGGFRGVYVGTVRGWILDRHRQADLMAYLEARGVPYAVTGASDAA
jgi:hypothetical protein